MWCVRNRCRVTSMLQTPIIPSQLLGSRDGLARLSKHAASWAFRLAETCHQIALKQARRHAVTLTCSNPFSFPRFHADPEMGAQLAADRSLQGVLGKGGHSRQTLAEKAAHLGISVRARASLENGAPTTQSPATIADPADNDMMQT